LSADDRAWLALAIMESGGPSTMARDLLSSRNPAAPAPDDWFASDSRDLALQLLAWTRLDPQSSVIDRLVAELLQSRRNGHWHTTQGNAWAVLALREYAERVEGTLMPATGRVGWAGQVRDFSLAANPQTFSALFPLAQGSAGSPLLLENPERRRLFTSVVIEARPAVAAQPRQDRGFGLWRAYHKIDDDGRLQSVASLHVGDRVLVSLTVEVHQPSHFVAIDDALPAVLEPMNPEFRSQQTSAIANAGGGLAQDWYSDHREFRADRALFFRDHIDAPGRYEIRYLARVRAAGSVSAPCAHVEEMYRPEHFGLSETVAIHAAPLE
jgi:uncharacterized protein YfaS (alpha-2-macroglobulin family)